MGMRVTLVWARKNTNSCEQTGQRMGMAECNGLRGALGDASAFKQDSLSEGRVRSWPFVLAQPTMGVSCKPPDDNSIEHICAIIYRRPKSNTNDHIKQEYIGCPY